jgi:hypothetical protein
MCDSVLEIVEHCVWLCGCVCTALQGQHERSVEWFRRALRLCRTYLSAWTLMGHEFVEMKNAPAAIGEGLFCSSIIVICPLSSH